MRVRPCLCAVREKNHNMVSGVLGGRDGVCGWVGGARGTGARKRSKGAKEEDRHASGESHHTLGGGPIECDGEGLGSGPVASSNDLMADTDPIKTAACFFAGHTHQK